jgi:hypothetical protein
MFKKLAGGAINFVVGSIGFVLLGLIWAVCNVSSGFQLSQLVI